MDQKLAIIHTTPATIAPLKALASEILPQYELVNFVDDSILPQLARNGGNLSKVEDRWIHYARFAEQVGTQAILSACSSVGDVVVLAQASMARVVATLPETEQPRFLSSPRLGMERVRLVLEGRR